MTVRILYVVPYVPSVVRVRPYQLIRALSAAGHAVHVVALRPPEDRWASADGLRECGATVELHPLSRARTIANAARSLVSGTPLQAAYGRHPGVERRVAMLAASGRFDVVHVEHLRGALLAPSALAIPRVFDAVDSITQLFTDTRQFAYARTARWMAGLDLARTRRFEARLPWMFDRLVVVSSGERDVFTSLAGAASAARVGVVSNGVDLDWFTPGPARPGGAPRVLFTGKMSYHANATAALVLARDVMPPVWRDIPDARLVIAGKDPSDAVRALARDPRIEVTGFLDDMRPVFRSATVSVVPLRYAVGVQNKVLEAMASGVPVVASPLVLQGVAAQPGREILVADDAASLARHVVALLRDESSRARIADAARRFVERAHRWDAQGRALAGEYTAAAEAFQRARGERARISS